MTGVIAVFGWLGIAGSVVFFILSLGSLGHAAVFLPAAAISLLNGALLVAFARVVTLLESLNDKLEPVHLIAGALQSKYRPETSASQVDTQDPVYILRNPPVGAQVRSYSGRRVIVLSDGRVVGETLTGGAREFASFEAFQEFVGK